jgi:predicted secreted Zn-dependent protease
MKRLPHVFRRIRLNMIKPKAVLAAVLLVAIATTDGHAKPIIRKSFDYYDVDGATAEAIRADIMRKRLQAYDGVTRWYVRWHYTYRRSANACEIASVTCSADVTTRMPRLAADSIAPEDLKQRFTEYLENLTIHEWGHRNNGIDTAARIEKAIETLPPAPTCEELDAIANQRARAEVAEGNRLDIEYDATTDHGRTQGARFPAFTVAPSGGGGGGKSIAH